MNEHRVQTPGAARPDWPSACLGLGSNSDPGFHLPRAVAALRRADGVAVEAVSTAWQSAAVGSNGPDYLNAALLVTTRLTRDGLKALLKRVENDLGRSRSGAATRPVTIDIDLLTFGDEVLEPDLWAFAYRVVPAAELLPALRSPSNGETLADAARCLTGSTRIVPRPDVLPGRTAAVPATV